MAEKHLGSVWFVSGIAIGFGFGKRLKEIRFKYRFELNEERENK